MAEEKDIFYEDLAGKYGWDPNGKKGAEEYIKFALDKFPERGEALSMQNKKLEAKDTELHEMKVTLDQLASDFKNQKEMAYQQALEDLKHQKRQAVSRGDTETFDKLEAYQMNLETSKQQELIDKNQHQVDNGQRQVDDALKQFNEKNKWFVGTTFDEIDMQAYAKQIDNVISVRRLPIDEHLRFVEEAVQKKFPGYFREVEEMEPSAVESVQHEENAPVRSRRKVFTINDLTEAQRLAAKYLSDRKQMTVDEYIKRLVDYGDLK